MNSPRFANILLSGPCNLRCPTCIGRQLGPPRQPNLDRFPLRGLGRFLVQLRARGITQVSLTGTDTDPLLYQHSQVLLHVLRAALPGVQISLHSNGILALTRLETFNSFDRATLSLPSLRPETCHAMTGRARPLDLERIVAATEIPLKISTLVTPHNRAELPEIIARCAALGIWRMVLRRPFGEIATADLLPQHRPERSFAGMPVYLVDGVEVTVWDFARCQLDCLNLYSDGTISEDYLLAASPPPLQRQEVAHAA